jgi:hypothetical protein
MNTQITFTPNEVVAFLLALSGFIITLSGAIGVVVKIVGKAKQPEVVQDNRIKECELRLDRHEETLEKYKEYFNNDDKRLSRIEESNRVTQRGMLALLKHSLNGDDVESLKKAEKDLENYLIDKER